jgi:hypothetical protein
LEQAKQRACSPHWPTLALNKVRDAPQVTRTDNRRTPTGRCFLSKYSKPIAREGDMGMVMIKCPQTGLAIPTGIKTDRESFGRRAVFFSRTRCTICHADHAWFAREAWVDEPSIRVRRPSSAAPA